MRTTVSVLLVAAILTASFVPAGADDQPCEVAGFAGIAPVGPESVAAIWLTVPAGHAVAGIRWYNNDDTVVFPEVLLASGNQTTPVDPGQAQVVATGVQGAAQAWCEVTFDQPYACQSEGLYCLFRLPPGSDYSVPGSGGGAGFGYTTGGCGHEGWFGGTDASWMRIVAPHGLAIEPVLVAANGGMAVMMSMDGQVSSVPEAPHLGVARPNPFNPQTVLEFSLPQAMAAELVVYDVRGKLIKTLATGSYAAGTHSVTWLGDDEGARRVSSGVYLVRFAAGSTTESQRVLLVK